MPNIKSKSQLSKATLKCRPKRLSQRHYALMRRILAGIPQSIAGKELGYSLNRTNIIVRSERFQDEMMRMKMMIDEKFIDSEGSKVQTDLVRERLRNEAFNSLEEIINLRNGAESEGVRQKSALEILDRAGYGKEETFKGDVKLEVDDSLAQMIRTLMKKEKDGKSE